MKKYKKKDPKIFKILVGKQLEKYGVTYDYVKEHQQKIKDEHGCEWYQYYTFDTKEEFESWQEFCVDFLMKNITPKISRANAEAEFAWLNLSVGLKQAYLYDKQTTNNRTPTKVTFLTKVKKFITRFFELD